MERQVLYFTGRWNGKEIFVEGRIHLVVTFSLEAEIWGLVFSHLIDDEVCREAEGREEVQDGNPARVQQGYSQNLPTPDNGCFKPFHLTSLYSFLVSSSGHQPPIFTPRDRRNPSMRRYHTLFNHATVLLTDLPPPSFGSFVCLQKKMATAANLICSSSELAVGRLSNTPEARRRSETPC